MKVPIALLFALISVATQQHHGSRESSGIFVGNHGLSGGYKNSGHASSSSGIGHRMVRSPQHMSAGGQTPGHYSGGLSSAISPDHFSSGTSGSRNPFSGSIVSHGGHRAGRSAQSEGVLSTGHRGLIPDDISGPQVVSAGHLGKGLVYGGHRGVISPSHGVSRIHG